MAVERLKQGRTAAREELASELVVAFLLVFALRKVV
jgi:hypothetical protein